MRKMEDSHRLLFIVDDKANKHQIRQTVQELHSIDMVLTSGCVALGGTNKIESSEQSPAE